MSLMKRSIAELLKHNITVVAIAGNSQHRPRDACRGNCPTSRSSARARHVFVTLVYAEKLQLSHIGLHG